jgi:predicted amidohydrolase
MSDTRGTLTIALVHDIFCGADGVERLAGRLTEARRAGAGLAVLPELPLDPWVPCTRESRDADAESVAGRRHRALADAAREASIGVLGGAIVRDPSAGRRHSRALLFDAAGRLVAHYDKLHLPLEEGFWEADHYEPGDEPPRPVAGFGLVLGLQICSDLFRPDIGNALGAAGVEVILAPRATPVTSYPFWRDRIVANAVSSGAFVVSANRPGPEHGVPLGGAGVVAAPDGSVRAESTQPLHVVRLERAVLQRARREYPGYLPVRSGLYARAWANVSGEKP